MNLAAAENNYQVQGWNTGDKLVLLGSTGATTSFDNSGSDAIVTINELGGQVTTVKVVGADLTSTDVVSASPLMLAADPITGGALLTQAELTPVAGAAINYWAAQGVDSQSLLKLQNTDVLIGNLGGQMLGSTDGNTIAIDDDAAGYGWSGSLGSVTPGKVDLFSALIHEYGHVLGYSHDQLGDELAVGERLLPLQIATSPQLI